MPHRSWTTVLAPFVQVPHQTQNRPQFPSTATSCRLSALDSSDNGWQCACNAVEQTMRHVPTYAKAQRAGGGVNICCGIQSCRARARDGVPTLSTGSRLQPIRCTWVDRVLAPPSHLRAVSARGCCFWTGKAGEFVSARVCAGMAWKHPAMGLGLHSKHIPYTLCCQRAKQGSRLLAWRPVARRRPSAGRRRIL